ncbi:GNAT family N-acetyltransferase [Nonomuraea roseoviolacea]|uniref:GNAT superfamily N-acetyltransferase n=1 Tax=Nonomuraea roseoviolacea subsp. carminata TaxID=160689 RepID=A0ABT1KDA5_9ACTN|nr:GNAT family N-acetyltransferase [Nonomuraea roseoviolacea]MCP2351940.1 GNAT superfamily N-acetyltransferase [Nonomuraea roseoviolacea subsp. carminata]
MSGVRIRPGGGGDVAAVLAMFDSAVAWLVSRGITGQWGDRPFTGDARRTEQVERWAGGGGLRIAEVDGEPAGCLSVGSPAAYVQPAQVPELYVQALVVDRRFPGRGVGAALLDRALAEAGERGAEVLRVDCYAGGDGRLVRWYEEWGFEREAPFTVGEWPGMVLRRPVRP